MTILTQSTIDITKVKTRWEEPYASEVIGRSLSIMPAGIHYGFRITPDGGTNIRLSHSSVLNESLVVIADKTQRLSFVYRETVEPTFALAAHVGTRVYILAYVNYSTGVATTAELRVVDAAELVNAWTNSAVLLGTVRVPSTGNINEGDIDHGSAVIAGLKDESGGNNGWELVTPNPYFDMGSAGWLTTETDPYVSFTATGEIGRHSLVLGDNSGTAGGSSTGISTRVYNARAGDLVYMRVRAKASSVVNATLSIQMNLATVDEVIIEGNLASYEWFGYVYEVPSTVDNTTFGLSVNLPISTDTGLFDIDVFEVWTKRIDKDFNRNARPTQLSAVAQLDFGTYPSSNKEHGALSWSDLNRTLMYEDGNLKNSSRTFVPFSDPTGEYNQTLDADANTFLHAMNFGWRAMKVLAQQWDKIVVSGGVVTDAGAGAVDVTQAVTFRGDATIDASRYLTSAAVSGIAPGDGAWVVAVENGPAGDLTIKAVLQSAYEASPALYTALAYVEITGGAVVLIVDVRDRPKDLEASGPLTVGPNLGRFDTIQAALKYKEINSSDQEIHIVESIDIDGTVVSGIDLAPAGSIGPVVIRGVGRDMNATAGTINIVGGLTTHLFDCQDAYLHLCDLRITDAAGGVGSKLFADPNDGGLRPRGVRVERCSISTNLIEEAFDFPRGAASGLAVDQSTIRASNVAIRWDAGAVSDSIRISQSTIGVYSSSVADWLNIQTSDTSGKIVLSNVTLDAAGDQQIATFGGNVIVSGMFADCNLKFIEATAGAPHVSVSDLILDLSSFDALSAVRPVCLEFVSVSVLGSNIRVSTQDNQDIDSPAIRFNGVARNSALSNVWISMDGGDGMVVDDTAVSDGANVVLTGIYIHSRTQVGSVGLYLFETVGVQVNGLVSANVADDTAVVVSASSTDNQINGLLVDQVTGAGAGFTNGGGATNEFNNVKVF